MVGTGIVLTITVVFALFLIARGGSGLLSEQTALAPTAAPLPTAPPVMTVTTSATPTAATPTAVADSDPSLTVCLDVGHGGADLGNIRQTAEGEVLLQEKDLVLEQALALETRLKARGYNVVLTRRTDRLVNETNEDINGDGETGEDLDGDGILEINEPVDQLDELQARVNICNEAGADLLVSMHVNGAQNLALRGYEAWWAQGREDSERSAHFAEMVTNSLADGFASVGFNTVFRGAFDDQHFDNSEPDPNDFQHFVMISPDVPARNFTGSTMPGAIVETLFLSNEEDLPFLTSEIGLETILDAYGESIDAYFKAYPEPVPNGSLPADSPARASAGAASGVTATPGSASVNVAVAAVGSAMPLSAGSPTPRPAPPPDPGTGSSKVIKSGKGERREIALTFDAGEDRGYTEDILNYLAEENIIASFGITGRWAENNPDLVKRMVAEGHQVFNHTYSHRSFTGFSTPWNPEALATWQRMEEIQRTHEIIYDLTGYDMRPFFRAPYGDVGPQSLADLAAMGYYITANWSVDSYGWKGWTAAEIAQHTIANSTPGGILLFHVGSKSADYEALPAIVKALRKDGYAFVTIEQTLQP
jgi:peptidoglycan/xylan/chitin deacetylase (PgdA/CDA1 family)/N-acetylmuramoyl-L-alanine amidase